MQICRNCNTINEKEAHVCVKCNMKGMLIPDNTRPINKPAAPAKKCKNCGCNEPGDGPKCNRCHFPQPKMVVAHDHHEELRKNA